MSSSLGLGEINLLALSSFFVTVGRLKEGFEEGIGGSGILGAGGITPPDGVVTLDVSKCGGAGGGEETPFASGKEKAPCTCNWIPLRWIQIRKGFARSITGQVCGNPSLTLI